MLKSLRLPCRRTACTTLERWGEWREEGELTFKVANSTQKAYHGPNWLRIFMSLMKRIVCVLGKQKFPSFWQNIGNESCYIPEHSMKRLQNQ